MKKRPLVRMLVTAFLFFSGLSGGFAQTAPAAAGQDLLQDPSWLIGATLQSIITQFGSPLAVYSVRGPESWQDDVVFSYDGIDLYWYQNRVWQIGLSQGYGIKKGDKKEAVLAILGEPLIQEESYLVFRLPSRGWPLRLRVSFSEQQVVQALYVYRPDY
jgi:hypothetical protein